MRSDKEIDPDRLNELLDDPAVRVIEVDVSPVAYEKGHIPGAIFWDAYQDLRHPDYTPISQDEFNGVLTKSGVTPETTVVFYGYAPYLGFWLMDRYGHERIRIMDGSRQEWVDAGHSWSREVLRPVPSVYEHSGEKPESIIEFSEVQGIIGDPGTVL